MTFSLNTHNGIITVENTNKGTHRTFRVRTQKDDANFAPGSRVLSLLVGADNTNDYQGIGFVKEDGRVILWRRYRTEYMEALVRVLQRPDVFVKKGCEYHYEEKCRKCNRTLTTPESIKSGIGPVCGGRE